MATRSRCSSRSRRPERGSRSPLPVTHLGALPLGLRPDELQLGRGEPIADTARVLSGYASAIVVRTFAQALLDEMAAAADEPGHQRPHRRPSPLPGAGRPADDPRALRQASQGVRAGLPRRRQQRRPLADGGRRPGRHATSSSARRRATSPTRRSPIRPRATALAHGGSIAVVHDPRRGGQRRERGLHRRLGVDGRRRRGAARQAPPSPAPYQVDTELMRRADREAIFLHCLPAHRGEEVAADVIDGPASVVFHAGREPAADRAGRAVRATSAGSWGDR